MRALMFVASAAVLLTMSAGQAQAGPATTTVTDIVYRADGNTAAGTLLISWPAFTSSDGKLVAAGSMNLAIGSGGSVTIPLVPNEGATPNGTYYKVVLKLADGTTETEYWSVPKRTPVKVAEVRSVVVPQTVAIQMASRTYVDSTLSAKADDGAVIHKLGDEAITGVKTFASSPTVPTPTVATGVANKSYVDLAVAGINTSDFLKKSGDVMTGSLTLSGDPSTSNQAANRHYVDVQAATLTSSVAQKLGRQGDTPITLAGVRFASQFASIQAAVTDAGTTGIVIIPSDYAGTDLFTNPNNVQVIDLRGDAAGRTGVYNIRDFGAKPGDFMDDWASIQAAIDAASVGTWGPFGAVFVPKGIFHVSKPLHITKGIRFYGEGKAVSEITGFSSDQGPVMVVSPPLSAYPGLPTGPALATGSGASMYLNGSFDYLLNLRDSSAAELNGRNALTIEFFYKPDFAVAAGAYNILASGGSATGTDVSNALWIQHVATDQITAMLNVGGVQKSVTSPANVVAQGAVAHIALTYDGSMLRLFVNGLLKASTAASGTISQAAAEEFVLGPRFSAFMESLAVNYMTKGWVDSIRISSNARYTSNFTVPTAKFTSDGNTMFLLNFDNNWDQFTTATTQYGPLHMFLRREGAMSGQVGNFKLSDLAFTGTGPDFMYMVSSSIDNVQVNASWRGMQLINNCYLNRISSLQVLGHASTQFDLGIGPQSGVLTLSDISLTGSHYPLYTDNSSGTIQGLWIELDQGTEIGAVMRGIINNAWVIDNPVFSNETNPTTVKYGIAEVGIGTLVMSGGILETSNAAPFVGVFGGGTIVHAGANYSRVGTAPATVYQIVTPPMNPIQLLGPIQQGLNVPYADNMAYMQTSQVKTNQTCTGSDKVTGINASGSLTCGSDSGLGYALTLSSIGANGPANSNSYYFGGNLIDTNNTNFDSAKIEVPKSGTIKRVYVRQNLPAGNAGSAEAVLHKVCVNTSTNCFGSSSFSYNGVTTAGSDITLNQAVSAGDTIAVRVDTPAWAIRPTNVRWYAVVYIE